MSSNVYKEPAAVMLTSERMSHVISSDPNSFLSLFSEGLLFQPKCGKMFMKVHPFHLKRQRRWLAFRFEASPPFFTSM